MPKIGLGVLFFHGLHTLLLVDVQPMDLLAGRLGRDWWVFILKVWGPVLVGTHLWHWNESNGDLSRPSGPPSTSRYTPLTKPDTTGDRTRDLLIVKRTRRPLGHVAPIAIGGIKKDYKWTLFSL